MPLHRDIFWVGRQWAVTGLGLQAVDQKQKSKFDVEIGRLWDDDLAHGLSAERWFNVEDFNKGLSIARARYPAAAGEIGQVESPQPLAAEPVRQPPVPAREFAAVAPACPPPQVEPAKPVAAPAQPSRDGSDDTSQDTSQDTWASLAELARTATGAPMRKAVPLAPVASPKNEAATQSPKQIGLPLKLRIERSGAKFYRMWRVRIGR